jgi:hypothetical protein
LQRLSGKDARAATYAPLSTVSAPKQGMFGALARKSPCRGPNFANTQCGAVRRRIPLDLGPHAQVAHNSSWRAYKKGESSKRRRDIAESRAQHFREYAMRGSPTPCPAQPQSHAPNAHHSSRRACQKRASSRRRCDIAKSRAQLRECAMGGRPRPDPARRGSPRAKYAPLLTESAPNQRTFEALARKSLRRGPNLADAQCEAVHRHITLDLGPHAPSTRRYGR